MKKEYDEKNIKRCPKCKAVMGLNKDMKSICQCEISADERYGRDTGK